MSIRKMHEVLKKIKKSLALSIAIVITASAMVTGPVKVEAATYTTTISGSQQTIKGWGLYPGQYDWYPETNTDSRVVQYLYKDLGMNVVRMKIHHDCGKSDGSLNTSKIDSGLAKAIQNAKDNGINKFILVPWSPPVHMKKEKTADGKCSDGTPNYLLDSYEDDFCNYYVKVIKYLRDTKKLGVPVAISVQNEHSYKDCDWDGCYYDIPKYKRVAKLLRQTLDNNNLSDIEIMGPESGGYHTHLWYCGGEDYPDFDTDSTYENTIGALAAHGYSMETGDYARMMRDSLKTAKSKWGKEGWMTEWCTESSQDLLDDAIESMRRFCRDVEYVGWEYWMYWLGWHPDPFKGHQLTATYNVDRSPLYYIFKKIWNNAPAGSVVKTMTSDDPNLSEYNTDNVDMAAFESSNGMVVVYVNHTSTARDMKTKGLSGSSLTVYQTTSNAKNTDMANKGSKTISNGECTVNLPGKSITVMVTNSGTPTPTPTPTLVPVGTTIRVEVGSSSSYTDTANNTWSADQGYSDGSTTDRGAIAIDNTSDDKIYQTERYGMTGYNFNVSNGSYTVKLHFAETYAGITAAGQRVFDVGIEGSTAISGLDIYSEAGGRNKALVKTVSANVSDGQLNISFVKKTQEPVINGIEIIPNTTSTIYQAEDAATKSGCTVSTAQSGYTGTGYVDYGATGTYIEWTNVSVPTAGTYTLTFTYANGDTVNRDAEVKVNGTVASSSLSMPNSGGWTTWKTVSMTATLNAGNNTVRVTAVDANGPNLDKLTVQ